jgi:hypothetical protein
MSVNDPDRPPEEPLTREEFIRVLVETGWVLKAAEDEWERFDKPVYLSDLEW